MAKLSVLDMLYTKDMNPLEFSFESLTANPLLSYLSQQDIYQLYKIAKSARLSTKPQQKYKMIEDILRPRGFKKIASGTNRVAYKHLEDTRIIIKVAIDEVGLKDSHREYRNQFLLKPFVTKVFEVSPCGTVGLFERVYPVQTIYEYQTIASDVFDVINTKIIGKYVVDDIGTEFFQNVGVRKGFGVVYLDFPYVYELDGKKLYCNNNINGIPCCGEIDYDAGFNRIICTKCGARYFAHQLKKNEQNKEIILRKGRKQKMKFTIMQGDEVVKEIVTQAESNVLPQKKEKTITKNTNDVESSKTYPKSSLRKRGFSISVDGEGESDSPCEEKDKNTINKVTPKQMNEEKSNENIKSSDFGGGISETYQNRTIVESEVLPDINETSEKTDTEDEAPVSMDVEVENDVVMVESLELIPRPYTDSEEYPESVESENDDDTVYETQTVMASY